MAELLREPTYLEFSGIRVVIDFYPESDNEDNRLIVYIRDKNGNTSQFVAETDYADLYAETGEIGLDPADMEESDLWDTRSNVDMCDEEDLSYPKRALLDRLDRIATFLDHGATPRIMNQLAGR